MQNPELTEMGVYLSRDAHDDDTPAVQVRLNYSGPVEVFLLWTVSAPLL